MSESLARTQSRDEEWMGMLNVSGVLGTPQPSVLGSARSSGKNNGDRPRWH
jgi:hypothetical protein